MSKSDKISLFSAISKLVVLLVFIVMTFLNIRISNEGITKYVLIFTMIALIAQIIARMRNNNNVAMICETFVFMGVLYYPLYSSFLVGHAGTRLTILAVLLLLSAIEVVFVLVKIHSKYKED